jgi:hypothetical protein
MQDEVKIPDVFTSLIAPLNGRSPSEEEKNVLMGDAMLIITAGRSVYRLPSNLRQFCQRNQLNKNPTATQQQQA